MSTFKVTTEMSVTPPSGRISWRIDSLADGLTEVIPTIPDTSVDFLVAFTASLANMEAIWFYTDYDITIYTNDLAGGAPVDTIVLPAGGWAWAKGSLCQNLITADITALYVTNASGFEATCKFGVLQDISEPI